MLLGNVLFISLFLSSPSDLLVELFGEIGKHARSAVGVAELPLGVYDCSLVVDEFFTCFFFFPGVWRLKWLWRSRRRTSARSPRLTIERELQ